MSVAEDFRELADQIDKSGDFPFHLAKNSSTWGSLAWCCHPNTVGRGVTINLNGVGGRLNVRGRLPLERLEETAAIMERALAGRVRRACRRALEAFTRFVTYIYLRMIPKKPSPASGALGVLIF
ncbi:MAG: hypothetical protein JRJ35_00955 [Deltaproteobacteria bacterium]|nr:hypothetical protein [Deltaproteobacteria bacterium]MBW1922019.1 hypothetical protein [Deltaproteobacteria bacterium]MBW1949189.1 hypothetical protein [Deltaproteobacteria bacterium]MBW2008184.1 hypothetical protein [Deltaproteobacteria bacterium]MBW2103180.1 hypothetical protein [Deltaproteobacteria bacterium]